MVTGWRQRRLSKKRGTSRRIREDLYESPSGGEPESTTAWFHHHQREFLPREEAHDNRDDVQDEGLQPRGRRLVLGEIHARWNGRGDGHSQRKNAVRGQSEKMSERIRCESNACIYKGNKRNVVRQRMMDR